MKAFRITVVVFIVACILAALVCVSIETFGQEEAEFTIAIISDPQIVASSEVGDDDYESFKEFNAIGQKMLFVSEAMLQTAVDKVIEEKVDCVLMPGDLTENGSKVGHQTVARECARLEAAGIQVFVINGNHDINKDPESYSATGETSVDGVSPEDFASIFAEFGYTEAVAKDTETLSYSADITGSDYRIIAVDAATYERDEFGETHHTGDPSMDDRLLSWTETQVKAANAAGKMPIIMVHFPLTSHMGEFIAELGISDIGLNMADEFNAMLTANNVKIAFTGHLHTQDINAYTDDNGTLYDIETGCLTNYPLPIRYLDTYASSYEIRTDYLNKITEKYIPAYVGAEIKAKLTTDLQEYALDFVADNLYNNIEEKIADADLFNMILEMLGMDTSNTEVIAFRDSLYEDLYHAFLNMPIYTKDAKANENSLQSICASYNVTLPASDYKSVWDLVIGAVGIVYKGGENLTADSTEGVLLRYGVYSVFYCLDDFDLFGKLHSLDSTIADIDLSEMVETLFTEQKLDLTADNFLGKVMTILNPVLEEFGFPISFSAGSSSEDILEIVEFALPGVLAMAMPDYYNNSKKTIMGIAIYDYINLDEGTILIGKLFDEVLWGKVSKGLLVDDEYNDITLTIEK